MGEIVQIISDIGCQDLNRQRSVIDMLSIDEAIAKYKEKTHTCNCKHNSNSRDSEPCCRCDSRQTNADRIRNMSDEELAEFLIAFKNTFGEEYEGEASCMDWLQSEAE